MLLLPFTGVAAPMQQQNERPQLTVENSIGKAPLAVHFSGTIQSGSGTLHFGDGAKIAISTSAFTLSYNYKTEGIYKATLVDGGVSVASYLIRVQGASAWLCKYTSLNNYTKVGSLSDAITGNGTFHMPPSKAGKSYYWSRISLAQDLCVTGDDMTMEVRLRNSPAEGGISCYDTEIIAHDEFGKSIAAVFMSPGCTYYARVIAGNSIKHGGFLSSHPKSRTDVSFLGRNFSEWATVRIVTKNKEYKLYFNDELIHSMPYDGDVGLLKAFQIVFKGAGSVDYIKLYDGNGDLYFNEDFDSANHLAEPTACADVMDELKLVAADTISYPSEVLRIPIELVNTNNTQLHGVTFGAKFDSLHFTADEVAFELDEQLVDDYQWLANTNLNGEVIVALWNTTANFIHNSSRLGYLRLKVKVNAALKMHSVKLEVMDLNELMPESYSTIDAEIEVKQNRFDLTFNAKYWNGDFVNSQAEVVLENSKNEHKHITNELGETTFHKVLADKYELSCDIDFLESHKQAISAKDISLGAKILTGLIEGNPWQKLALDATQDGTNSASDLSALARFKVGLIDSLNGKNIFWLAVLDSTAVPMATTLPLRLNTDTTISARTVLLGDLTGNLRQQLNKKSSTTETFSLEVVKGETIKAYLSAANYTSINEGINTSLSTSNNLRIVGVKPNKALVNDPQITWLLNAKSGNKANFLMYTAQEPIAGTDVLEIELVALASGFAQLNLQGMEIDEKKAAVSLQVTERKRSLPAIDGVSVLNGSVSIRYYLPQSRTVQLSLYTTTGKKVVQLFNGAQEEGEQHLKLDIPQLATGVYLFELHTGESVVHEKIYIQTCY